MKGWRACGPVLCLRVYAEDFSVLWRRVDRRLRLERGVTHLLH